MSISDIALGFMTVLAVIVVVPIIRREIRRRPSLVDDLRTLVRTPGDRAALEEVDRPLPSDPAAAHQVLHEHFARVDPQEEEERAALRAQAALNPAAAEQLHQLLSDDLEVWTYLLQDARKKVKRNPSLQIGIANLEKWERETRTELAEIERLVPRSHGAA